MKKIGTVLIAALIGTILFEIISPPIDPHWLKFVIEIIVTLIFALIGLAIFKYISGKSTQTKPE